MPNGLKLPSISEEQLREKYGLPQKVPLIIPSPEKLEGLPEISESERERMLNEAEIGIPTLIAETIKGLPSAAKTVFKTFLTRPVETVGAVAKGIYSSAIEAPAEFVAKAILPKKLEDRVIPWIRKPAILDKDTEENVKKIKEGFEIAGLLIPYGAGAKAAANLMKFIPRVSKLGKFQPFIERGLGFTGTGQVLYSEDEGVSRAERALTDLALLGAFEVIGFGVGRAWTKLKGGGNLTVPEAEKALSDIKKVTRRVKKAQTLLEKKEIAIEIPEAPKVPLLKSLMPMRELTRTDPRAAEIARLGRNSYSEMTYDIFKKSDQIETYFRGLNRADMDLVARLVEKGTRNLKPFPAKIARGVRNQRILNKEGEFFARTELGVDTKKWRIPIHKYFHHHFVGRYQVLENAAMIRGKVRGGKTLKFTTSLGEALEAADKSKAANVMIVPRSFKFDEYDATLLGRKAFWRFVNNLDKRDLIIDKADLKVLKGVAAIKYPRPKYVPALKPRLVNLTGYDTNLEKVNKIYWGKFIRKKYLDAFNKEAARLKDRMPRGDMKDLMEGYIQIVNNPYKPFYEGLGGKIAPTVTMVQAMAKLGFRPIAALINRAQSLQTAYPEIGSYLFKGRALAFTTKGKELLKELKVSSQAAKFDIAKPVQTRIKSIGNPLWMFGKAEIAVREEAGLGGYLFAKDKIKLVDINKFRKNFGLKLFKSEEEMAVAFGKDLVSATQYIYDISDYPAAFRGPLGRMIGQFRSFTINYLYGVKNVLTGKPLGGLELYTKLTPKQKITRAVRFLATNISLGGIRAIPYSARLAIWAYVISNHNKVFEGILTYMGIPHPENPEIKGIKEQFIARGVPGLLGIDLSYQIGVGEFLRSDRITDLLGVTFSDLANLYEIITTLEPAEREARLMRFSPAVYRAYQAITADDYLRSLYQRRRPEISLSPGERLAYGLGFTPLKLSEHYDITNLLRRERGRYKDKRQMYVDQIVFAFMEGDIGTIDEIVREAQAEGINITARSVKEAYQAQYLPSETRMFKRLPKDMRLKWLFLLKELQEEAHLPSTPK